jgi:hypothetical protein
MKNIRVGSGSERSIVNNRSKIRPWKYQRLTELMGNSQFDAAGSLREQICIAEPILRKGGKGQCPTWREVGTLFNLLSHIHRRVDSA